MRNPPRKVLLFTNAEHGQANVFLAVSHALIQQGAEVHFASFPAARQAVQEVSRNIIFHEVYGIDMKTAYPREEVEKSGLEGKPVRFWHMAAVLRIILHTTMPWSGPQYVEIYRSVIRILQDVVPDIIAIDPAFSPALTACRHMGERFLILAPNTIKDFAMPHQPSGEAFWKFPCVGSGLPYPIPWYYVLLNIYFIIVALIMCRYDERYRGVKKYIRDHTGGEMITLDDLNQRPPPGVKYLVANLPELDFPLAKIPPHIIPCGPIIRLADPVADSDPDLAAWLARGPTVYINLGTHAKTSASNAVEIARALAVLLDEAKRREPPDSPLARLQVLWKLTRKTDYGDQGLNEALGEAVVGSRPRVRIESWIAAEPASVLASPTLVCAVHHGGANSFNEALAAGVPQVVLPAWIDTFDYASRAELLGVGRWGNRTAHPRCRAEELAGVLVDVVLGQGAGAMRERAREVRWVCARDPGRDVAARVILGEI